MTQTFSDTITSLIQSKHWEDDASYVQAGTSQRKGNATCFGWARDQHKIAKFVSFDDENL